MMLTTKIQIGKFISPCARQGNLCPLCAIDAMDDTYYYYYFISYIAQPTTILIYALYIIETVTSIDVLHIERYYRHIFRVHGIRVHFP